jgi:hypothetical protein
MAATARKTMTIFSQQWVPSAFAGDFPSRWFIEHGFLKGGARNILQVTGESFEHQCMPLKCSSA